MTCYSTEAKDRIWIFVKSYRFLPFAKNMIKNISKNLCRNSSGKYNQKLLDHAKQFATNSFKTVSKRTIQKTEKAIADLIGNKIADQVINDSKILPQNSSERAESETKNIGLDREIARRRYTSPEKRQKVIDDLILIYSILMEYQKIISLIYYTANQPSNLNTTEWVKINDDSSGTYNVNSQLKSKTITLNSSLSDYSDAYIAVPVTEATGANVKNIV